jgi:hypothetical protein
MRGTELRGLGRAASEGWQAYRFFFRGGRAVSGRSARYAKGRAVRRMGLGADLAGAFLQEFRTVLAVSSKDSRRPRE